MRNKILTLLNNVKERMTLSQIAEALKIEHLPVVLYHLKALVTDGKIRKYIEDKTYEFINESKKIKIAYYGEAKAGSDYKFALTEEPLSYIAVDAHMINHNPDELMLVSVSGTSMEPTLQDGSLVMFKRMLTGERPMDDKVTFCRVDGGLKIKRYKDMGDYGLLLSDNYNDENPENKPILLNDNVEFEALGRFIVEVC